MRRAAVLPKRVLRVRMPDYIKDQYRSPNYYENNLSWLPDYEVGDIHCTWQRRTVRRSKYLPYDTDLPKPFAHPVLGPWLKLCEGKQGARKNLDFSGKERLTEEESSIPRRKE